MPPLFAQAATEWLAPLASIANIGFSIVVGWYLITKGLPHMQERFGVALKEQRDAHDKQLDKRDAATDKIIQLVMSGNTAILQENSRKLDEHDRKLDRILEMLDDMREGVKS